MWAGHVERMERVRLTKRAGAFRVERRRRRGRPRLSWEECVERFGGNGRGVKTFGGDDSEMGSVTKKKGIKKLTIGIGASLIPDFSDKKENNNLLFELLTR